MKPRQVAQAQAPLQLPSFAELQQAIHMES